MNTVLRFILGVGLSVEKVWGRDRSSKMTVGTQGYFNGLIEAMSGFFHKLESLSPWLLRKAGSTTWAGHTMAPCSSYAQISALQRCSKDKRMSGYWCFVQESWDTQPDTEIWKLPQIVSTGRQNSCSRLHKESVVKKTSWSWTTTQTISFAWYWESMPGTEGSIWIGWRKQPLMLSRQRAIY